MNETEQTKYKVVWSFLLCDSERKHITNEVSSYKMFFNNKCYQYKNCAEGEYKSFFFLLTDGHSMIIANK